MGKCAQSKSKSLFSLRKHLDDDDVYFGMWQYIYFFLQNLISLIYWNIWLLDQTMWNWLSLRWSFINHDKHLPLKVQFHSTKIFYSHSVFPALPLSFCHWTFIEILESLIVFLWNSTHTARNCVWFSAEENSSFYSHSFISPKGAVCKNWCVWCQWVVSLCMSAMVCCENVTKLQWPLRTK